MNDQLTELNDQHICDLNLSHLAEGENLIREFDTQEDKNSNIQQKAVEWFGRYLIGRTLTDCSIITNIILIPKSSLTSNLLEYLSFCRFFQMPYNIQALSEDISILHPSQSSIYTSTNGHTSQTSTTHDCQDIVAFYRLSVVDLIMKCASKVHEWKNHFLEEIMTYQSHVSMDN